MVQSIIELINRLLGCKPERITYLPAGNASMNYRVDVPGGNYLVRFDTRRGIAEQFYDYINAKVARTKGVLTPPSLQYVGKMGDSTVSVRRYIPGNTVSFDALHNGTTKILGENLGRIHAGTAGCSRSGFYDFLFSSWIEGFVTATTQ